MGAASSPTALPMPPPAALPRRARATPRNGIALPFFACGQRTAPPWRPAQFHVRFVLAVHTVLRWGSSPTALPMPSPAAFPLRARATPRNGIALPVIACGQKTAPPWRPVQFRVRFVFAVHIVVRWSGSYMRFVPLTFLLLKKQAKLVLGSCGSGGAGGCPSRPDPLFGLFGVRGRPRCVRLLPSM